MAKTCFLTHNTVEQGIWKKKTKNKKQKQNKKTTTTTIAEMVQLPTVHSQGLCYDDIGRDFYEPNHLSWKCVVESFNSWSTVPLGVVAQTLC